jgi:hypothetical protein
MDLSQFNKPQVVRLLKGYNSRSKNYLRLICSYFSDYYNWCLAEGYIDNTNFMNYYDYTIAKPIIEEVVPLRLIKDKCFLWLDLIEYKEQVPDPVNKFILYATFFGIYGSEYDDLVNLKMSDINEKQKTVKLKSGIIIQIDDLFIELAKAADKAIEYKPEGEGSSTFAKKPNRYVYDESCYIIKNSGTGVTNTPVSKTVIMNRFRLMQKQTDNKFINGTNLYKNGLINYVKEQFEKDGVALKDGLFLEIKKSERTFAGSTYVYTKKLQQYINEYGSSMTDRAFRLQLKEVIELYE